MLNAYKKSLLVCALLSIATVSMAGEGVVGVLNKKGILSVVISGEAALDIEKSLVNVHRVSQGMGATQSTIARGKQITCSKKSTKSECSLTIDDNGTINAATFASESNAGKVTTQKIDGRVSISVSGKAALQMLNVMKNVQATGTMTTRKESGDIRCSVVREFKSENASCTFYIDSSGSAASK